MSQGIDEGDNKFDGMAGRALLVPEMLSILGSDPTDDVMLDALVSGAPKIIRRDLVHRLVPFASRLRSLDYADHAWAALPAGVAIAAVDRRSGRRVLRHARRAFEASKDSTGLGWACFLEGLEDLGEGKPANAEAW